MANPWFRVWADMVNDPKWRTIARTSKQKIGDVIAVYLHMLTCASNATERGRTEGWSDEDVATALDIETDDVGSIREAMQGRVLDDDYLRGWEKRQPLREDGAAERSKTWREKQKNAKETQPNATERNRTLDTEEIREEESKPKAIAAASPPPDCVISIPIIGSKEFPILQSHVDEWAGAYPGVDIIRQLAAMRQWCLANPTRRKTARGVLSFCNAWLTKEQNRPRSPQQARASPPPSKFDPVAHVNRNRTQHHEHSDPNILEGRFYEVVPAD